MSDDGLTNEERDAMVSAFNQGPTERSRQLLAEWRKRSAVREYGGCLPPTEEDRRRSRHLLEEANRRGVEYAEAEAVLNAAARIAHENGELLGRLADSDRQKDAEDD